VNRNKQQRQRSVRSFWNEQDVDNRKSDQIKQHTSNRTKKDKHELTKVGIAEIIASEQNLTIAKSKRIVDSIFDIIVETVANDGTAKISGFGSFECMYLKEKNGFTPNGKAYKVGVRKKMRFRQYKALRDTLNTT